MTGWFAQIPGQFNWYVDALVLMYMLAPFLHGIIKKSKNIYLSAVLLLSLAFLVSVSFWHTDYLILATRIPIFILGFILADDRIGKMIDSRLFVLLMNIVSFVGILSIIILFNTDIDRWHYGIWWYPFFLIIPGVCIDVSLLLNLIRNKVSLKYLDKYGKATFSIYLWHIFIFEYIGAGYSFGKGVWVLIAFAVVGFAICYHLLISKIFNVFIFRDKRVASH